MSFEAGVARKIEKFTPLTDGFPTMENFIVSSRCQRRNGIRHLNLMEFLAVDGEL